MISDARIKKIISLWKRGKTRAAIAREIGCSGTTVRYHIDRHTGKNKHEKRKLARLTPEQERLISKLAKRDVGHVQISKEVGCSRGQARYRAAKALGKPSPWRVPSTGFLQLGEKRDVPPPQHVLNERDRRNRIRPRDLTAAIFGDPLPGYSALERKQNELPRQKSAWPYQHSEKCAPAGSPIRRRDEYPEMHVR